MPCFSPLWELVCYTPYPSIWPGLPNQSNPSFPGEMHCHISKGKGLSKEDQEKSTDIQGNMTSCYSTSKTKGLPFKMVFILHCFASENLKCFVVNSAVLPTLICLHSFVMKQPQFLTRSAWNCWGIKHTKQCPAYAPTLLLPSLLMQKLMHPHMHVHMQKHLKVPCYFYFWQWISKLLPLPLL